MNLKQSTNKIIKISLMILSSLVIIKNIVAQDVNYFKENWFEYFDMVSIPVSKSDSLEAIKFNLGFVANADLLVASFHSDFCNYEKEYLEEIDNLTISDLLNINFYNENLIKDRQNENDSLKDTIINEAEKLQNLFLKYKIRTEEFESIKNEFLINSLDDKLHINIDKFIEMILWISYAQRRNVMVKVDFMVKEAEIKLALKKLEINAQKIDTLNRIYFESAINCLQQKTLEDCKKILKKYENEKTRLILCKNMLFSDIERQKKNIF